jgi:hypothetical protein
MQDLSYKEFFSNKKVSHEDALKERIRGLLANIIADEKNISEKSFKLYDEVINHVKSDFSDKMFAEANMMYNQNKRLKYIAELLYDKYFKDDLTKEGMYADVNFMPISMDDKKPTGTGDLNLTSNLSKNTDGTIIDRKKSVIKKKLMTYKEFNKKKKKKQ